MTNLFYLLDILCPYLSFPEMDALVYAHPFFRKAFTDTKSFANMILQHKRRSEKVVTVDRVPNAKIEEKLYHYDPPLNMSITDVYGLKLPYFEAKDILCKEYGSRLEDGVWDKYLLVYAVEILSEDLKSLFPQYNFHLHTTGFVDDAGLTVVLGIEICKYVIAYKILGKGELTLEERADIIRETIFSKWGNGKEIHPLPYVYQKDQKDLDVVIEKAKKLVNHETFTAISLAYYKVENCEC